VNEHKRFSTKRRRRNGKVRRRCKNTGLISKLKEKGLVPCIVENGEADAAIARLRSFRLLSKSIVV